MGEDFWSSCFKESDEATGLRLKYNYDQQRYGIWDSVAEDWHTEGLHCGTCFDVRHNCKWVPVRIEWGTTQCGPDWYLVGMPYPCYGSGLDFLMVQP